MSHSTLPTSTDIDQSNSVIVSLPFASLDPATTPAIADLLSRHGLSWFCPPTAQPLCLLPGAGLRVVPDAGSDFWCRTYYEPLLLKHDGHHLWCTVPHERFVVETTFEINTANQFDQAGIMLRVDEDHWVKAGIEYADGDVNLSVVVTNQYSDWSTTVWPSRTLSLRLFKLGPNVVIERKDHDSDSWRFVRIARIEGADDVGRCRVGLFVACPAKVNSGGSADFRSFEIRRTSGHHHTNA